MIRLLGMGDHLQGDKQRLGEDVLEHSVTVLKSFRELSNIRKVDGFRLSALYQGLKFRIRNSGKNPSSSS